MTITTLEDLFAVETLSGLVKTFADQSQDRPATQLFQEHAAPILTAQGTVSWEEQVYSRGLAPLVPRDGPHPRVPRLSVKKRSAELAWIKAYKDLPGTWDLHGRAPWEDASDLEDRVGAELLDLGNLISATREYLATGALLGRIEVDEQKIPNSDVAFTLDFDVQEEQALASWADPRTKIRGHELPALKRLFKAECGLEAGLVLCGPEIDGYLTKNEDVRDLARGGLGPTILAHLNHQGTNPQWTPLAGLQLRFFDATYRPEGGPLTRYFPEDRLVVLPGAEHLRQVLGWAEGPVWVPKGSPFRPAYDAKDLTRTLRGSYAYAELRQDPIGLRLYAGWRGLPLVLSPSSLLRFKVRP